MHDAKQADHPPQNPQGSQSLSFAYTATIASGAAVTDRIVAESSKEAWTGLEQRGYRDITLHNDDGTAIKLADEESSRRLVFSAKEEIAFNRRSSMLVKTATLFFHRSNVSLWLPMAAWFAYSFGRKGWSSNSTLLAAALLATYLLWFAWARIPALMYNQALEASTWCRWKEVERWMRWMTRWKRWFNTPLADHELLFRTGTAEAGQGRLAQGLRRVAPLATDTRLAPGFYQVRLSSLYYAAKEFAQVERLQRESYSLDPTDTRAIDLASTLAIRTNNPLEAATLLEQVEPAKISPMARIFYLRCQGVIALETQQPLLASSLLAEALSLARKYVGSPLMQGVVFETRAFYGLALAASGDIESASAHFKAARPMLIAHRETALLARCDAAQKICDKRFTRGQLASQRRCSRAGCVALSAKTGAVPQVSALRFCAD